MSDWTKVEHNLIMQCIKNGNSIEDIAQISEKSVESITEKLKLYIYDRVVTHGETPDSLSRELKLEEKVVANMYESFKEEVTKLKQQKEEAERPLKKFLSRIKELLKLAPNGLLHNTKYYYESYDYASNGSFCITKHHEQTTANKNLYDYIVRQLDEIEGRSYVSYLSINFNPTKNEVRCGYYSSGRIIGYTESELDRSITLKYSADTFDGCGNFVLNFEKC